MKNDVIAVHVTADELKNYQYSNPRNCPLYNALKRDKWPVTSVNPFEVTFDEDWENRYVILERDVLKYSATETKEPILVHLLR